MPSGFTWTRSNSEEHTQHERGGGRTVSNNKGQGKAIQTKTHGTTNTTPRDTVQADGSQWQALEGGAQGGEKRRGSI